jgi:outer membrane protein
MKTASNSEPMPQKQSRHSGRFDELKPMLHSACRMRMFRLLLIIAAGAGFSAAAQTNGDLPDYITNSVPVVDTPAANVRQLSLQDCIQLALQHNIELQIDRYNPQIAYFTLHGDYGPYDPSLFLLGEHSHNEAGSQILSGGFTVPGSTSDADIFRGSLGGLFPWGMTYSLQANANDTSGTSFSVDTNGFLIPKAFENGNGSASATVSQPLLRNLWIDQTRLNIRVAKNRLKYSELELKLQIMQTITTLEQAYYDLIYAQENVRVQQKAVEYAERTVSDNKKKLEVGSMAPLDLANAEAQAAHDRAAVIAAKSQLGTQERKVKQLIAESFSDWADVSLRPVGALDATRQYFNRQESWGTALRERPELLQARLDADRAGIQLKYSFNQLFPELDVFGTYGYNGSGKEFSGTLFDIQERNRPFYVFGGQITIPLANISARNAHKSDKLSLQQAVLAIKKQERDILIAVDNDIGSLESDYDQVQATRASREYEEQALDAEQKKLENGKSTTYTVLQVQRDLTTARGLEIQALDTYNRDRAQLSLDEGSTLERLKIHWQAK